MTKAFKTKSRIDDFVVSFLMLIKSVGIGVIAYHLVGWLGYFR
jgi:hypothetical protein